MDRERLLVFGDQKQEELAFSSLAGPWISGPSIPFPSACKVANSFWKSTPPCGALPRTADNNQCTPHSGVVSFLFLSFSFLKIFLDLLPSELKSQQTHRLLSKLLNWNSLPDVLPLPVRDPSCSAAAICLLPACYLATTEGKALRCRFP